MLECKVGHVRWFSCVCVLQTQMPDTHVRPAHTNPPAPSLALLALLLVLLVLLGVVVVVVVVSNSGSGGPIAPPLLFIRYNTPPRKL